MQRLIDLKDRFDVAFACDTDHDRHGIVTPQRRPAAARTTTWRSRSTTCSAHRPQWRRDAAVGKTVVSSALIDRVAQRARPPALRSAGRLQVVRRRPARRLARLRRRRERRRLVPAPRRHGLDDRQGRHRPGAAGRPRSPRAPAAIPGALYAELDARARRAVHRRVDAPATPEQKKRLAALSPRAARARPSWPASRSSSVLDERAGQRRARSAASR